MVADFDIFRTILGYCVAIIALPISTFFTTKILIFDQIYGPTETAGNVYAAICAVVMLHIALGAFVYKAYSGDDTPRRPDKMDKFE